MHSIRILTFVIGGVRGVGGCLKLVPEFLALCVKSDGIRSIQFMRDDLKPAHVAVSNGLAQGRKRVTWRISGIYTPPLSMSGAGQDGMGRMQQVDGIRVQVVPHVTRCGIAPKDSEFLPLVVTVCLYLFTGQVL
jgi:hypothetical protein